MNQPPTRAEARGLRTPVATDRAVRVPALALRLVAAASLCCVPGAWAQTNSAATVVDVHPGDTFSAIAARYTGDVRSWRKLYNDKLSGIANPDRIAVGMRFELVTEPGGNRYLKLVSGPGAAAPRAVAAAAPAPAPAPAAVPTPAAPKPATPAAAAAPAPAPAAVATPLPVGGAAGDGTLVLGVLPNIPAPQLQAQYDHLKRYLERVGAYKVRLVLPANFKAFYDSTMRGEYDLAVAAPHFARVAQVDKGMVPLVTYEPRINALFIAPIEGGATTAKEVREKAVAFANPTSLVAMYGQQWLSQQKLEPTKDYEVKSARTDMGVGRMLLTGEATAAIMSNGEFRALPPEESSRLKIVEVFARMPNFILLANPKLDRERTARLKSQLKTFLADPEDGAAFAKATGFSALVDTDDAMLKELDPYVPLTRRVMGPVN